MSEQQPCPNTVPTDVTAEPMDVNNDEVIFLPVELDKNDWEFWPQANKQVLWGWKRDVNDHSRAVYYSATLCEVDGQIGIADPYFYYTHRTDEEAAVQSHDQLDGARSAVRDQVRTVRSTLEPTDISGFKRATFEVNTPSWKDDARLTALLDRTPRDSVDNPSEINKTALDDLTDIFPVDLYAGSGVSYECGLPKLKEVHDWFCLDNYEKGVFTHSDLDTLPRELQQSPLQKFRQFASLHAMALTSEPAFSQREIADLYDESRIRTVFSDNVDNMFSKVGVPFERTRGSGVLNERYPATFETDTLLVVGVAADRRDLIKQARNAGMDVIVVDPIDEVSLGVQHLSYVREQDRFYETTANEFFSHVRRQLS